jgi:hypothetical protein
MGEGTAESTEIYEVYYWKPITYIINEKKIMPVLFKIANSIFCKSRRIFS